MSKKKIEYYAVEVEVSPYNYDDYPAFTNPILYLSGGYKRKLKFKTKEEMELFLIESSKALQDKE